MAYVVPADVEERPISIVGGGTLGRRIAMMFAAGGSRVQLVSRSADSREAARRFVDEHASDVRERLRLAAGSTGTVELFDELGPAVSGAWLVVESVSEDLALKQRIFRDLDRLAEGDVILATNSSSYPSSRFVDAVEHPERVLNVHFQMPPELLAVELMSCGKTDAAVIDALVERLPRYGVVPFTVMRESVGLLFNRIWHATRRECLMVVAEGVSTPEEVDRIWQLSLGTALGPFRLMDRIGLDVVLAVEEHYATIRDDIPAGPLELLRDYVDKGRLGLKTGRGFYDDYGSGRVDAS
jgi:3-hydroxybutyryl-CoA dehydrogenase